MLRKIEIDKYDFLCLVLLVTLGCLVYANTFQTPFIFDDNSTIKENPSIRMTEISWDDFSAAVSGRGRNRPVSTISFAINYYFGQYSLPGYHLVNIIVHIVSGILLFFFLKTTLKISSRHNLLAIELDQARISTLSGLAALLWLVNPVQTQSVTYIVQRTNSMAAMFFMLAMFLYAKGRLAHRNSGQVVAHQTTGGIQRKPSHRYYFWYLGCIFAGILALGSKENAASLPFFILLYEWYFFQDLSKKWLKEKLIFVAAPVVLIGIIILWIHLGTDPLEKIKSLRDFSEGQFTLGQRLLTQTRVVIYYLSLIIWPHPSRLNLDYDFPLSYSFIEPLTTLPSLTGIIGLIILAGFLAKKQRLLSFCLWWFLGNLVIESSIIPLAIIFEHRLYLPSMLIFLLLVIVLFQYVKPRWLPVALSAASIAVSAYWTYERNSVWRDPISLWSDCIRKSPQKSRPYANLANALKERKLTAEALQNYRKSLQLNPNHFEAHNNLGVLLEEQSSTNEAIKHYRKAIELSPNFANAHNNLGSAYHQQGQWDEAEKQIRKTLQIDPNHAKAHNNLGVVLSDQGRLAEAFEHFRKSLQIDPDMAAAHDNIGRALQKQGKIGEAVAHYRKALEKRPDYAEAHFHLAEALIETGQNDQAADHIQKALQINPDNAQALNNIGARLLKQGNISEAARYLIRALSINPELAEANNNFGIILIRQGNREAAISHFQQAVRLDPDFEPARNNLQRALAMPSATDTETGAVQKELEARPDDPALHFKMGNLHLGKRQLGRAIAEFEKALALQPDFLAAQNNLAMAYAADRQNDRALAAFKKLIVLDPDNPGNYYNVAVMYALQNKVPDSIAWLKQAIERGYQNWELIKTDKDLANVRNSPEYQQLVEGH